MSQYQIVSDEGWTHNAIPENRYHHFYTAISAPTTTLDKLQNILIITERKFKHNHRDEIKWSKLNGRCFEDYKLLIDTFFDFWEKNQEIKLRQLFLDRRYDYMGDSSPKERLFKVYYQFLKHSFGLQTDEFKSLGIDHIVFRLDDYPDKQRKITFTDYIENLYSDYRVSVHFVDSKKSPLLQIIDIIMGAAGYYGNCSCCHDLETSKKQQNICKTKFARYIRDRLAKIDMEDRDTKAFSWLHTTGGVNGTYIDNRFKYRFAIWKLIPSEHEIDLSWTKKHNPKSKLCAGRQKAIVKGSYESCTLFE